MKAKTTNFLTIVFSILTLGIITNTLPWTVLSTNFHASMALEFIVLSLVVSIIQRKKIKRRINYHPIILCLVGLLILGYELIENSGR